MRPRADRRRPQRVCLAVLVAAGGCTGSRWAKRDPAYAEKYPRHTDNPLRVVKQAIDARHLTGRNGLYSAVEANRSPAAADVSVGVFSYPHSAVETRFGLRGVAVADSAQGGLAGGAEFGLRVQSPSRLAPFLGASVFAGQSFLEGSADTCPVGDFRSGCEDDVSFAGAFTPEVGAHLWLTPQWRLTAFVSHTFVDFEGRGGGEFTAVGVGVALLDIPGYGRATGCSVEPLMTSTAPRTQPRRLPPTQPHSELNDAYATLLQEADWSVIPPGTIRLIDESNPTESGAVGTP